MEKIKEYIKLIGEEIKASEEFAVLQKIEEKYNADEALQVMLIQFNRYRDELLQARDMEKIDKDKVLQLQKDMQALYTKIMQNKTMEEYTKAREDFDNYTEKVHTLLNAEVYGEQATGCNGSCASCSGCH